MASEATRTDAAPSTPAGPPSSPSRTDVLSATAREAHAPSTADAQSLAQVAAASAAALEPNTLFVKVERLRRLHQSDEYVHTVRRGEDGTFGLGLSEDNQIIDFHHEANTGVLRLGDQIRSVNDIPLVRERLSSVLQKHHPEDETVVLHLSRATEEARRKYAGSEIFAALQQRDGAGAELDEWLSELWELRTDCVWGAFWTLPILPGAQSAWLGIHLSKMFTEPLLGCAEIPLDGLPRETLECRWYSLRTEANAAGAPAASAAPAGRREIEGEVLLTTRRFYSSASICPDRLGGSESESEDELDPSVPVDHSTEPLAPIEEPLAFYPPRPPR